jgi:hypothetical protein
VCSHGAPATSSKLPVPATAATLHPHPTPVLIRRPKMSQEPSLGIIGVGQHPVNPPAPVMGDTPGPSPHRSLATLDGTDADPMRRRIIRNAVHLPAPVMHRTPTPSYMRAPATIDRTDHALYHSRCRTGRT